MTPTPHMTAKQYRSRKEKDTSWETEYASILRISQIGGQISSYRRLHRKGGQDTLSVTLSSGKRIKYTPDFEVVQANGKIQYIEVKGRTGRGDVDRAGIKNFQHFTLHFPQYRFTMVTKEAGKWTTKYDENRED